MFEKTLQDVVKGIRAHKRDPSDFISATIAEIKIELKSSDPFVKAQAIRKLTYLQMLGYDMSWAAFYVVEVMTMPRFAHKRVGYLAANQCFTEDTEVVLLCTNHLQKEFKSQNPYDVGLAINCLANIATPDLSRDLISDLVQLLGNHKPYVRKKALLAMYKLFIKYPQGLRLTFDRIKERLEDNDNSVVSCAVNVICELADKNPKNYLAMAPQFFRLLTTSSNNWMLIKVVKLLGSLVPEEPRLARKLLEPLATIIQNTAAKSLLYECIHTMTLALPFTRKADGTESKAVPAAVRLCSEHLRKFTEDSDQNLKYLGLVGFVNLMCSHPRAVAEHRSLVLACLSDDDVTIRTRALELLSGMVTKRNLEDLVLNLLEHVSRAEGPYREELIAKIIFVEKYAYLTNFRWYTGVLIDLSHVEVLLKHARAFSPLKNRMSDARQRLGALIREAHHRVDVRGAQGSKHGTALALQLIDVSVRVEEVREYAVHKSVALLAEPSLLKGRTRLTMMHVLGASAWIVGEYCLPHLETLAKRTGDRVWFDVMQALLAPEAARLPASVQVVYVQNAGKVFAAMCVACKDDGELGRVLEILPVRLNSLMRSPDIEVQERSFSFFNLLVAYNIVMEPEGAEFHPGEAGAGEGTDEDDAAKRGGKEATGENEKGKTKSQKDGSLANGKAAAVLDLLGLDPEPSTASGVNGFARDQDGEHGKGSEANGGASESDAHGAKPLMLTGPPALPPLMGPIGAAREAASHLAALTEEVLKPVNPRAQSRVPGPEDVDLDAVIDGAALERVLAIEEKTPTDLSRLSFTEIHVPKSGFEDYRVSFRDDEDKESYDRHEGKKRRKEKRLRRKRSGRDADKDTSPGDSGAEGSRGLSQGAGASGEGQGSPEKSSKGAESERYKSDPFYLSGGGGRSKALVFEDGTSNGGAIGEAEPSGYALSDGGGAERSGGRSKRSGKKTNRKEKEKRSTAYEVDTIEVMPAAAALTSEEEALPARGSRQRPKDNSALGRRESRLAAIDITTPLEDHERMPEVKPYVRVTAASITGAPRAEDNERDNGGDRSRSRNRDGGGKGKGDRNKDDDRDRDGSSKRKKKSSSGKHKRSARGSGSGSVGATRAEPSGEIDLIGFQPSEAAGSGTATPPPLLLQNAPGGSSTVGSPIQAAPLRPTAVPNASAGIAMRAPPSNRGIWENDLSAILAAAAPTAQQAQIQPQMQSNTLGPSPSGQVVSMMGPGWEGVGGVGGVGSGSGVDGGRGYVKQDGEKDGRRRDERETPSSAKPRKERSSKSSSSRAREGKSSSSRDKKSSRSSRREER